MAHSRIFQISSTPICPDDYKRPDDYYENSDFADYIGDEVTGEERDDDIGHLADTVKDVFTPIGQGVLAYRGKEAMNEFKRKWAETLKKEADEMTAENITHNMQMFRIGRLTEETHLLSDYRVDITNWTSCAYPLSELFVWAENCLEEGDHVYIGSVIDYHY